MNRHQRRAAARTNTNTVLRFVVCSSLVGPGGQPVTEFRIWQAGLNPDRNGFGAVFNEAAAKAVMAAQAEHGVDLMIDLEHLSVDDTHPNYDPDARGWARLEVRRDANGGPELWAVGIRWTPDGQRRLSEGTQLYPSPAFFMNDKNEPMRVKNIALVAMPATDHASPLAAKETPRDPMNLLVAIEAAKTAVKLSLAGIAPGAVLKTLAEDGAGEAAGVSISELATVLGIDIDPGNDPAGFIAALKSKLSELSAKLDGTKEPPKTPDSAEMPPEEMAAAKLMLRLMDRSSFTEGALRMNEWRSIVTNHEAAAKKVADDQAALEMTERLALVKQLPGETPATTGLNDGKLCKRLAEEPIAELRARVATLKTAGVARADAALVPKVPTDEAPPPEGLSATELAVCKRRNIDPAAYAAKFKKKSASSAQKGG